MSRKTLIQTLFIATASSLLLVGAAQAQSPVVHKLPTVVITGKSLQTQAREDSQRVVQLPRVIVEGRSLAAQQREVQLAAAKSVVRGS